MSNYPSPYPQYPQQPPGQPPYQPGYYGYPPQDPVASLVGRCKRAGILQIVLASITLLCGGCSAAISPFMTLEMISQAQAQAQVTLPPGFDLEMLRKVYLMLGIGLVIFGVTLIILGAVVIRASKGAAITAMVMNILGALLLAVLAVVQLTHGQPLEGLVYFAIIGILAWQIIWHVQAVGAAGQIAAVRAQGQYYPPGQPGYGYQYGAPGQPYSQPAQQQQQWPGQQQQQQWPPQQQNQQQQWPPPPQQPPPSS